MCNLLRIASSKTAGLLSYKPLEDKLHTSKVVQLRLGLRPLADSPVIINGQFQLVACDKQGKR